MKRPAFMFYPADWRKDPELRVCSIAARGLWIDMIALMHEGEPYGHLLVNGVAVSDVQLARLVGEPVGLVRRLLAELESHNVFSRNDVGAIFSRRMVQDEHIRTVRAESGKLGGNPNLKVKAVVNQTAKQNLTPSVAVAVASSEQQTETPQTDAAVSESPALRTTPKYPPEFETTWAVLPTRSGSNSKQEAHSAWRARRKSGVSAELLHSGAERYSAYCVAKGIVGTEYVKQGSSFFGKGEHYLAEWTAPVAKPKTITVLDGNGWYYDEAVPA